ncbi:MAG: DUF1330 domain-containing protein [Dermatophilaceae bacterium]|nr:DUF1330 domain-containing protein [Intrasporangiaceae bacterium]
MTVGHIDPSRAAFDAFKGLPRDEPIHMLNLVRFREEAEYPEGHEHAGKGWSGRRAYREYGLTSGPVFSRVGGSIVWRGAFDCTLIGPEGESWDVAFIAQYPSGAAFLEMVVDEEYRRAVANRTAALADSRLVRFAPGDVGSAFG